MSFAQSRKTNTLRVASFGPLSRLRTKLIFESRTRAENRKPVRALKDDLQVDEFLWAFEDGRTEMTGNIYMARNFDNRYSALEMWWSID
ncbi:hypothetical protein M2375_000154 [Comamonas sp. BIGb0152]|uniref:hypothetical protein n=1 Tax=Comamonas sp. BIGb0152 TaxID=2940601 RepID=UPI002168A377|nr:hypothetical protein [Comamonas sp. BIGb0152]MCS4291959.1 hypothetical protein [Comamonas sp. BIGb0152]